MSGAKPESVFSPKTSPTDNRSVQLIFKHNTYYSGSRTDKNAYSYPIFNFASFYKGESSTVDFSDNIIYCPASGFNPNYMLSIKAGWWEGSINNNLIIGHQGRVAPIITVTATGDTIDSSSDYADITIKDNYTSLSALNLASVNDVFADAANGDFTIYTAISPLGTLSSTGGCLGATRWMSTTAALCNLTRSIAPTCDSNAGTISGPQGLIQKGKEVTLKAIKNFGFKFVKWTDDAGNELCDSTVYTFILDKDMTVYAVFDTVSIYKLTINILGGKGEYSVSATGKDGGYEYYEAGTELTITALESPIFTFLAWYTNPETGEGYEAGICY
jgi:hypothetical protein